MLTSLLSWANNKTLAADVATLTVLFEQADGTWRDISGDVISVGTNRGKSRETDAFQAGTASLVLRNETRNYDPNYSSSPYNGSILPQRRIQVCATVNSVFYRIFTGYIDSWTQDYQGPHYAEAKVQITDGFKILNRRLLAGSVWEAWIRQQATTTAYRAWWRLSDPAGATVAVDQSGVYNGTYSGTTLPAQGSAVPIREPDQSRKFDGSTSYVAIPSGASLVGTSWTAECWLNVANFTGTQVAVALSQGQTATDRFFIGVRPSNITSNPGRVQVGLHNNADLTGLTNVIGLDRVHIMFVRNGNTETLYVNGTQEATATLSVTTAATQQPLNIGRYSVTSSLYFPGIVDEVILWDSALTATDASDHFLAGSLPLDGQSSDSRITKILDWSSWGTYDRNLDAGQSTLQATGLGGSALSALQLVEATEEGMVFIDTFGRVRFISRRNTQNQAVAATFGDGGGSELPYFGPPVLDFSDTLIYNEIKVTRDGGTTQVASDTASQSAYDIISLERSGLGNKTDLDSANHAQYLLNLHKDVVQRITAITLKPRELPTTLFPTLLGLELGQWVTVLRRPQNVGSAISQTAVLLGINHQMTAKDWTATLYLSPVGTQKWWQLGVTGFGELGVNTRLGW